MSPACCHGWNTNAWRERFKVVLDYFDSASGGGRFLPLSYLLLQDYELLRRPDAFPSIASQFLRVIQLKTCCCCPALHLLETEMTVSRPSKKPLKMSSRNTSQRSSFQQCCGTGTQNLVIFLNPEAGNRDPGTGMEKIGSGIFLRANNCFGLNYSNYLSIQRSARYFIDPWISYQWMWSGMEKSRFESSAIYAIFSIAQATGWL